MPPAVDKAVLARKHRQIPLLDKKRADALQEGDTVRAALLQQTITVMVERYGKPANFQPARVEGVGEKGGR